MSGEYMTMAEIEAKYPNEWVLIDKPEEDSYQRTTGGWLVFHSVDKDEVCRRGMEMPSPRSITFLFTGTPRLAADEEFAL
jgi:hypothetical protein